MLDRLRTPLFVLALLAIGLVVLLELGSSLVTDTGPAPSPSALQQEAAAMDLDAELVEGEPSQPSGRGIGYLALVDGILLYTVLLMGLSLLLPDRVHGRLQGVLTIIASIVLILVALVMLVIAFVELVVMLTLFMAAPFGTLAYLAVWGFFPTGETLALLGLLLFLKLVFLGLLVGAHQRFLQNKGLMLLVLVSLVCTVVLSFLQGFPPSVLVSITDAIGAIIFAVIAIIWAIVLVIGSIPSVVKAVKAV